MLNFLKRFFWVGILIVLYLLVYHSWFLNLGILTNGDWVFFFRQTMDTLRINYFSLWLGDYSFGRVVIDISQAPTYAAYGFLSKFFGINYALSERIIHFWPAIILAPLSSYLLLNKIFKNKVAVIIGILIYSFNTYFLILQTGILTLMVAFSLFPLIIFLYIQNLEKKSITFALLTALALFLDSSYETRATYILAIILGIYFIYYLLFIYKSKKIKNFLHLSFMGIMPIIITVLLSLFWIIGLFHSGYLTNNAVFERGLFGSDFLNILYAITLYHPFWTGSFPAIFHPQPIPYYYWFIPVAAFLGLYFNRQNKNVLFFGIISILGIFLTKQEAIPFNSVYSWLFRYLPGFNAFREASKFYSLIALGYSVLIAGFIKWLWDDWKGKNWQRYGKYFLTVAIALIFLWNTKPLITGEIGTLFVSRNIPNDYIIAKNYMVNQSDYFRSLWVPRVSTWSLYTANHPEISFIDVFYADWSNLSKKYLLNNKQSQAEDMLKFIQNKQSNNLLKESSVKYIIVPTEDKANDDDFFVNYGEPRKYYIDKLDKINYLHKINIGTKDLVIYENYGYRPHLYATRSMPSIYAKNVEPIIYNLKSRYIAPSEYWVNISNVKGPFYLNFSESFNNGWKLRIGNLNWFDVLTTKNYFLPDKYHFENNAMLNSFYINPSVVCKVENCKVNKDGNYDINLTLYFASQSYMYLGLLISGSTLVLVVGYLFFVLGRNIYDKRKN